MGDIQVHQVDVDFSHLQDVLGSQPILRTYIPLCVCFHLNGGVTTEQLENDLLEASQTLARTFPFLAGKVVLEGVKDGHSGVPKILPHNNTIPLVFKDLTSESSVPTSAEMKRDKYPLMQLDPCLLVPSIVSDPYPLDSSTVAPVFLIQASFIKGGLLITFAMNHQIMDATGQGQVIELFAKALRRETFTHKDQELVNRPRAAVVPLFEPEYQLGPEFDYAVAIGSVSDASHDSPLSPGQWAYIRLSAANLSRLKSDASQQNTTSYVSTDDAIGALCWQAVVRARQKQLVKGSATQFVRPVNVRKRFGLESYVGHMADVVYTDEVDVHELPLGSVAGKLRLALQQDDKIRHHMQALATLCHRLADKSQLLQILGAGLDLQRDTLVSSWTNMRTCGFSYGHSLGVPEASRCPWKDNTFPMMLTMPKDKDGSIALAVCLAGDDMVRLQNDKIFRSYVDWIG